MKRVMFILLLILGGVFPASGQKMHKPLAVEQTVKVTASYPISASEILRKDWEKIGPAIKEYARTHQEQNLEKPAAWNFTVGQKRSWWATDLSVAERFEYSVPSTCRAVGTHCYIFVEDAMWGTHVDQEVVDSIEAAFDSRTPADPTKGIYQIDVEDFGDPPNVDNDSKIIILILDIKDGYSGSGGYIAGYFWPVNELPSSGLPPGRHSNRAEIYYVDSNPANLKTADGRRIAASTTSHEFQHMIHYNYDEYEELFVNEGLSEAAEVLCGYGLRSPALYYANTNVNFLSWGSSSEDLLPYYARAALFTWYLIEQFGVGIARDIVQSNKVGFYGYNDAFSTIGSSLQFPDALNNFAVAVGLNDTTADSKYGFKQVQVSSYPAPHRSYSNPNVPVYTDTVKPFGTHYISFEGGESLSMSNTVHSSGYLSIQAIATGSAGKKVSAVPMNGTYVESDFGKGYDKVVFALTNQSGLYNCIYDLSATGAGGSTSPTTMAFDDGNPEGYYAWKTGDSVAVQFDSLPGATLDSISVAFRRSGSISYGIWKYSGSVSPSPFSQNYGIGTMVCTNDTVSHPYPIPYPNWVKTDVSGWNIDLNHPFVIGFAFGDDSTHPGLMMSEQPYTTPHHSFSYFNGSSGRSWYIVITNTEGDTTAANYLVHAYVHYGTSAIASAIEILPKTFDLAQNYPNPFNPETVIRYTIPIRNRVQLIVYDLLGREVAALVDQIREPGTYEVKWDGKNGEGQPVGSGVYFYTLRTGSSVKTNKMVILR
jgi:hypothetical protein